METLHQNIFLKKILEKALKWADGAVLFYWFKFENDDKKLHLVVLARP